MKQAKQRRRCSVWHCISRIVLVGCFAVVTFASLGVLFPATSHAAAVTPPNKMNFQGRLTDASGNPLTGTYDMQFKLYSAASGGTLLWAETRTAANANAVTITSGLFSVRLGEGTLVAPSTQLNAVVAANANLYFEITVGADAAMTPRSQLATSAYAFNSDTLDGIDSTGFIQNGTSPQTADFNISGTGVASTLQAATFDTSSAGTLSVGTTNATGITLGKSGVATTTAGGLLTSTVDTASAGALTLGGTNATSIALNQNVTVAANKSLTLSGGTTASRPTSPTEGMLWYDTTTKQLLTYSNGKWQADRNTATKVVAASTASQALKDGADYVATGTNDQTTINSALTAAAGGKVYLTEGTFTIGGSINIPNNTTLAGAGYGTLITIPNNFGADLNAITNTTTGGNGTGITIQDLRLDGNQLSQGVGANMYGIYLNGVGSGAGASAIRGGMIVNVIADNWTQVGIKLLASANNVINGSTVHGNNAGINLTFSSNNTIADSTAHGNSGTGIALYTSSNNTVNDNIVQGNDNGIFVDSVTGGSSNNTIVGNMVQGNSGTGAYISSGSNRNTVNDNVFQGNREGVILYDSMNNTIDSNNFHDNGGNTANNALYIETSDKNTVMGNTITDTSASMTNYAINILNNTSDLNYLADNTFSSTPGTATINDAGTGTVYANQSRSENGGQLTNRTTNNTEAFAIQNASGVNMLAVDSTNSKVLIAGTLDTTTATTLNIGSATATAISIGKAGITTTILGSTAISPQTSTSTTLLCSNGGILSTCDSSVLAPTLSNFIRNSTTQQSSSNFNISGTGVASILQASTNIASPLVDAISGSLSVGTTTATSITLGKSGVGTTAGGTFTSTGLLTGNAGATVSGAVTMNTSGANAVNINTGSATGTTSIGNSAAGAITLQSASTVGITGTTTVNGLTSETGTALTVSNSTSTGTILDVKDNTTSVMTVADGGALVARNSANSTAGFSIQNATNYTLFTADTTNSRLIIGTSGGDTTGTLLVLGNKTNEGDPTGVEGAMYYNGSMKSFRCYRDAMWGDCGTHNIEREWAIEDEFFAGQDYDGVSYSDSYFGGNMGSLGWNGYALGASGSFNIAYNDRYNPPTADHPGVIGIGTSTNGTGASLFLSSGMWDGYGSVRLAANSVFKTSVRSEYASGFDMRIGLHNQVESRTTEPTAGIWFGVNATNEWEACYYGKAASGDSNAVRCLDTNVATTATWTRLEFRIVSFTTGSIQIDYYINGTKYTPVSNGSIYSVEGGTYGVAPIIQWWNTNTTVKQIAIDYVQIKGTTSAAR